MNDKLKKTNDRIFKMKYEKQKEIKKGCTFKPIINYKSACFNTNDYV